MTMFRNIIRDFDSNKPVFIAFILLEIPTIIVMTLFVFLILLLWTHFRLLYYFLKVLNTSTSSFYFSFKMLLSLYIFNQLFLHQ